jgi:hypothetical protein
MRCLLTPPGAEDARRLPDDFSDLVTKNLVVMAIIINASNTNIGTQVNGVTDTTICPAQGDLEGYFAVS